LFSTTCRHIFERPDDRRRENAPIEIAEIVSIENT